MDNFASDNTNNTNQSMLYVEHCNYTQNDEDLNYLMPANEPNMGGHARYQPRIPVMQHNHPSSGDQEKLNKKRERNRIAASKCRQRKLEKIQTLEEQVYRLKKENEDLQRLSERLRDHLEKSRAQLDFHHRNGCSIDHLEGFPLPPFESTTTKIKSSPGQDLPPDSTCLS